MVATLFMATGGMVLSAPTASAATAITNLKYQVTQSVTDSNVYKSVDAFCPEGSKVLGGAYELRGAPGAVVLDDFIPFDNGSGSGLRVGAGEIVRPGGASGTDQTWSIVATAVCGTPPRGYSIITRESGFTNDPTRTVIAPCPPERRVLGGGASLANGWGQVSFIGLKINPTDVQAYARADKSGFTENWSATAYAICADPATGWNVVSKQSPNGTPISFTEAAYCRRPQHVIGAAWRIYRPTAAIDSADRYVTRTELSTEPDPGITVNAVATKPGDEVWAIEANAVCVD